MKIENMKNYEYEDWLESNYLTSDYTDEEFRVGFLNQKRLSKDEEIKEILKHKDINF